MQMEMETTNSAKNIVRHSYNLTAFVAQIQQATFVMRLQSITQNGVDC